METLSGTALYRGSGRLLKPRTKPTERMLLRQAGVDPKTAAASAHSTVIAGTGTGFRLALPLGSIISEIKL